jgi:hypothetical protein
MRGKGFTEEQIIAVLMEVRAGSKVIDVLRKYMVIFNVACYK